MPVRVAPYVRLLGLAVVVYAAAATFRADGLALSMALDGAFVALFAATAAMVFLSTPERHAVLRQMASAIAGILVPSVRS